MIAHGPALPSGRIARPSAPGGPRPRGHPTDPRSFARHRPRPRRHHPHGDARVVRRDGFRRRSAGAGSSRPRPWQPGLTVRRGDGLEIELDLDVALGVPVAEVARQVDSAVRYAVRRALDREVDRLVIHIDGLRVQPGGALPAAAPPVAPSVRSVRATWPTAGRTSPRWPDARATATGCSRRSGRPSPISRRTSTRSTASTSTRSPTATRARTCSPPCKAALDEAEAVAGQPAERVAAAISFGALMGARGNSGVITSQIFRGMAEGLAGKRRFNGLDLAHALSQGAKTAYGAVAKPVEGTILTVIRESAAAAVDDRGARQRHRGRPGRDARGGREVGRPHAEPAGHPARGRRGRLRRAGPVSAVPGRAAPPDRQDPGRRRAVPERARGQSPARSSPTPTRGSATRRCSCCGRPATRGSTSTPSATTSSRSASPCSWPATRGRSRSTSTTSGRTSSSATA